MTAVSSRELTSQPPVHHLSDELLLDYASGALDEASSLFVSSHLTLCPHCRARQAELDALGGVLLEELEPVSMATDAFASIMARAEMPEAANDSAISRQATKTVDGKDLPAPLRRYFGCDLDGIAWEKKGGGVSVATVPGIGDGSHAFMLKVEAGRAVPQHTHQGNEYVMVLQGAYADENGKFGRGDVELADGDVDHQPIAASGEDCVCLAVTDAPLKFTGSTGWLLNMFVKM